MISAYKISLALGEELHAKNNNFCPNADQGTVCIGDLKRKVIMPQLAMKAAKSTLLIKRLHGQANQCTLPSKPPTAHVFSQVWVVCGHELRIDLHLKHRCMRLHFCSPTWSEVTLNAWCRLCWGWPQRYPSQWRTHIWMGLRFLCFIAYICIHTYIGRYVHR